MSTAMQATPLSSLPGPSKLYEPEEDKPQFAFAQLYDQVVLVQVPSTPASSLAALDISVFRHEFVTLFRYSHRTAVHPSDIRILERLDDCGTLHEEENGTVFLAKELMMHLSKWRMSGRRGIMGMQTAKGTSSPSPMGMAGALQQQQQQQQQARASRRMNMPAHRQIPRY